MSIDVEQDYYALLGVPQSATTEEIKRAYRALARRYHPDSRPEEAPTSLFHEAQAAYAVLSDPNLRRAYDQQRADAGLDEESVLSWDILLSRDQLSSAHDEQVVYVLMELRPSAAAQGERLPLNLCLVVDRSTSMQGARLEHVKGAAHQIIDDALRLEDAGTFAVVLELIPSELARRISERLAIPTIGIGAGPWCDGQVLTGPDMLGMNPEFAPKFLRRYEHFDKRMTEAFQAFIRDVQEGTFPGDAESY